MSHSVRNVNKNYLPSEDVDVISLKLPRETPNKCKERNESNLMQASADPPYSLQLNTVNKSAREQKSE